MEITALVLIEKTPIYLSDILYEASPSMVRMRPLGTLLVSLLMVLGVVLAVRVA